MFEHLILSDNQEALKKRPTLVVQKTELSTEIDNFQARNKRLRPKLLGVIPARNGLISYFGDSNPIFQIES